MYLEQIVDFLAAIGVPVRFGRSAAACAIGPDARYPTLRRWMREG